MVREDIVAGLKNAVGKGESLETAKQSFISAGYSKADVEEASSLIQSGSVLFVGRGENFPPLKIQTQTAQQTQQLETLKEEKPIPNKSKSSFKIILLVIILLFLIGILILTIVFKDKIITLFS